MISGETIDKIRKDNNLRNKFIDEYTNFILSVASKTVGSYVDKDNDFFSIALIAFNEAINKFDKNKGDFLSFASVLIRNRLIDELRKTDNKVIPFSSLGSENDDGEIEEFDVVGTSDIATDVAFEFETLKTVLLDYDISLFDIPKASPKALKTKQMVFKVLMFIMENEKARNSIINLKELPMKMLMDNLKVSKKLLERHRKYIITATIILDGEYPIIAEYIKNIGR